METKAELEAGFEKKCLLITLKGTKKSIIAASRFVVL